LYLPISLLGEPVSFRALDLPYGAFLGLSMVIPSGTNIPGRPFGLIDYKH